MAKTSFTTWLITGLIAIGVGGAIIGGMQEDPKAKERQEKLAAAQAAAAAAEAAKTPQQREQEAQAKAKIERDFQFALTGTRAIRSTLKDPSSFDLVFAGVTDQGTLCLQYRGKNSFGAVVPEQKAISSQLKTLDWNKNCGNKTMQDFTHLKRAL